VIFLATPVTGQVGPSLPADRATHLQHLAFFMLPGFVVGSVVAIGLGVWFMALLAVPQGELLTTAGFYGWVAGAIVTVVMAAAPVMGLRFAFMSQRLHPASATQVALICNAAALVYVLATTALNWIIPGT
jgi:hypothetical protein